MVFDHPLVFSRSITRIVIIAPLGYGRVAYRKMIGSKFGRKQHHLLRSPRFASVGRMLIGSLIPEYGSVRKVLRHACPEATGDLFSVQIVGHPFHILIRLPDHTLVVVAVAERPQVFAVRKLILVDQLQALVVLIIFIALRGHRTVPQGRFIVGIPPVQAERKRCVFRLLIRADHAYRIERFGFGEPLGGRHAFAQHDRLHDGIGIEFQIAVVVITARSGEPRIDRAVFVDDDGRSVTVLSAGVNIPPRLDDGNFQNRLATAQSQRRNHCQNQFHSLFHRSKI